ncbi:MAG: DAK2 domain-containing protein [Alicyclobacillus herbarius]|uniref:DAK2 domain-containing protein n=1 Tax=Alicyclobacillus herbarius TaxID=122960 RepID=UPI0023554223|nr:DAK2 domain-containing protein [Alicyclobacillus herbarius]MCL6632123.1 DAK2 domain-containing protein [Alicyclobacillus herbarius]
MAGQQYLNGTAFAALLRAGHQRLHEQAEFVNTLNIFPVPDGDTGTNMDLSFASGINALRRRTAWDLHEAAQAFATGLLMGARGNSGVILSQLFRGFVRISQGMDVLDARGFAQALQEGVDIAYKAVSKPVEGTILTVAREAAQAGVREARSNPPLSVWMETVHAAAQAALAKTPSQLPVLKQAGVVDSGGQGLVFIYEGFLSYLMHDGANHNESASVIRFSPDMRLDYAGRHIVRKGEHGYCTEVLVRVTGDTQEVERKLRRRFEQYGDSLLVVAAGNLVRVHVHTLHPGRVLEDALGFGPLVQIKIENMTEQHDRLSLDGHADTRETAPVVPGKERPTPSGAAAADDAVAADGQDLAELTQPQTQTALVAVVSGDGLKEVLTSLGAVVVDGGQSMNPSTEEIVAAARQTGAREVIFLPNNKNIVLAAEQAREVLDGRLVVAPCITVPQGIAAAAVFDARESAEANRIRMESAVSGVLSGCVAMAARDSQYQGHSIQAGQFMAIADPDVVAVYPDRAAAAVAAVRALMERAQEQGMDPELLTIFSGRDVKTDELQELNRTLASLYGLEIEIRHGGQPVYDYIFSLE